MIAQLNCPGYIGDSVSTIKAAQNTMLIQLPQIGGSKDSQDLLQLLPVLVDKHRGIGRYLNQVVPWIVSLGAKHFPCRAGHNVALDAAMRCTAMAIRELLENNHPGKAGTYYLVQPSMELTRANLAAVASLRQELEDPQQSLATETLFTTLLLCCFEV